MSEKISRRQFVKAGVGAAAAAAIVRTKPARAVVISSRNGNAFRNGGPRTAVEEAYLRIARGEDVLDACMEDFGGFDMKEKGFETNNEALAG